MLVWLLKIYEVWLLKIHELMCVMDNIIDWLNEDIWFAPSESQNTLGKSTISRRLLTLYTSRLSVIYRRLFLFSRRTCTIYFKWTVILMAKYTNRTQVLINKKLTSHRIILNKNVNDVDTMSLTKSFYKHTFFQYQIFKHLFVICCFMST